LNRATTALTLCVHSKAAQKPTNVFFFAKRSEFTVFLNSMRRGNLQSVGFNESRAGE